jgi:drug/metabolite transporter (DMT)-like permease
MIFTRTLLGKNEPLDLWTILGTLFIVLGVVMTV